MIRKILLDKFGTTEFLDGDITAKKVDINPSLNESGYNKLVAKLNAIEKDPVQVDLYLKTHGLDKVEGLKDYILNNDIKQDSVNNLIQTQNYKNIADQAHGFLGVKKAIDAYKNTEKYTYKTNVKYVFVYF